MRPYWFWFRTGSSVSPEPYVQPCLIFDYQRFPKTIRAKIVLFTFSIFYQHVAPTEHYLILDHFRDHPPNPRMSRTNCRGFPLKTTGECYSPLQ